MSDSHRIRVGIVGVGNCASALVQGVHYYSTKEILPYRTFIGQYRADSIDFVVAFDVDKRKIGFSLRDAIFQLPNCCMDISRDVQNGPLYRYGGPVLSAPILDGVSQHMRATSQKDTERYYVDNTSDDESVGMYAPAYGHNSVAYTTQDVDKYANILHHYQVDVLINYLPVGSQIATEFWASVCIKASVNMVNCIPVFIASNPQWSAKFANAKCTIVGDDMKSQFGASVLSQMFQELAESRGHKVLVHIQQNSGGNTDFLNMCNQERLKSKKISKENVLKHHGSEPDFLHAGPSDYIRHYKDTKVAHFKLDLLGFGRAPVTLDAKLEVQDSPNSAGVVIDALRYAVVAQQKGIYGALEGPSAFTQKSPPKQMSLSEAIQSCDALSSM